ncbi:MAG: hypothetical protein FK733_07355 [Asgard group archaeon]|nr:hypothetical protein [Asgard group archaeon]
MSDIRIYLLSSEGLVLKSIIIDGKRTWEGIFSTVQKEHVIDVGEKTNQAIRFLINKKLIIEDEESRAFYKSTTNRLIEEFTEFYYKIETKPHQEKRNVPFIFKL